MSGDINIHPFNETDSIFKLKISTDLVSIQRVCR